MTEDNGAAQERIPEALGQSEAFLEFQENLSRVAKVDRPVLLIGERGTGKELAARRLHYLSKRWDGPLVTLNCAALAPSLIESELFGHEAGAFTGASSRRSGRFERANQGTLFLDEIGITPIEVQEKILRVVEYGSFERVGGSSAVSVDVRIVGATHSDLPELARKGDFKQDLLDRLSFDVLFLPPLRNRREDIIYLAMHFAARMAYELGMEALPEFSDRAIRTLESYDWPGNIRQLKNVVERAVYRSDNALIDRIDFDPFRSPYLQKTPPASIEKTQAAAPKECEKEADPLATLTGSLPEQVQELEILRLRQALEESKFNQRQAADRLGLTYHQFRGLYRKHGKRLDSGE